MVLRTPPSWLQNGSHPAENDRLTTQGIFRTTGILSNADLTVSQSGTPAMSVSVAAGWAAILGTYQALMGCYVAYNDAAITGTVTTAHATLPRIDLVCFVVSDAFYTGVTNTVALTVVAGTPNASPTVPATPANAIALAQIAVAAAVTTIVTANITDLRVRATTPDVAVGTVASISNAGYMGIPQNATTTGAYGVVAADNGTHIRATATRTVTLPANATIALPIGFAITFTADTGATMTIAITTDTMYLAGPGTTGSRTLAPFGMATAIKTGATSWMISGNGLT